MRNALKKALPAGLRNRLRESFGRYGYARTSYSQEGEDLILLRLFDENSPGIYVDVGAHHPYRFSNTCLLHDRGWRGINIDARPGSMAAFRRARPRDINLEVGISEQPSELEFFLFEEPALNTFDRALAESRLAEGWPLSRTLTVPCRPLADVLATELPRLGATAPDLLSVDVEGLDLEVLRSSDWQRYRPRVVIVEVLDHSFAAGAASPTLAFLGSQGYTLFAKLYNSAIFLRDEAPATGILR
jgi:FkbM family methyltransferase